MQLCSTCKSLYATKGQHFLCFSPKLGRKTCLSSVKRNFPPAVENPFIDRSVNILFLNRELYVTFNINIVTPRKIPYIYREREREREKERERERGIKIYTVHHDLRQK